MLPDLNSDLNRVNQFLNGISSLDISINSAKDFKTEAEKFLEIKKPSKFLSFFSNSANTSTDLLSLQNATIKIHSFALQLPAEKGLLDKFQQAIEKVGSLLAILPNSPGKQNSNEEFLQHSLVHLGQAAQSVQKNLNPSKEPKKVRRRRQQPWSKGVELDQAKKDLSVKLENTFPGKKMDSKTINPLIDKLKSQDETLVSREVNLKNGKTSHLRIPEQFILDLPRMSVIMINGKDLREAAQDKMPAGISPSDSEHDSLILQELIKEISTLPNITNSNSDNLPSFTQNLGKWMNQKLPVKLAEVLQIDLLEYAKLGDTLFAGDLDNRSIKLDINEKGTSLKIEINFKIFATEINNKALSEGEDIGYLSTQLEINWPPEDRTLSTTNHNQFNFYITKLSPTLDEAIQGINTLKPTKGES